MTYCATCASQIDAGSDQCPNCGRDVLRIVDARPTVEATGQARSLSAAHIESEREAARELVGRGIGFFWSCCFYLLFWGIGVWVVWLLFGPNPSGWWVLATATGAVLAEHRLSNWWGEKKRLAFQADRRAAIANKQ